MPIYQDSSKRHVFILVYITQQYLQCYVIEIKVDSIIKYELYFTHQREAYIKRAASINMLGPKEIK